MIETIDAGEIRLDRETVSIALSEYERFQDTEKYSESKKWKALEALNDWTDQHDITPETVEDFADVLEAENPPSGTLASWQGMDSFKTYVTSDPERAAAALKQLFEGERPLAQRISEFRENETTEVRSQGIGYILAAYDMEKYAPIKVGAFETFIDYFCDLDKPQIRGGLSIADRYSLYIDCLNLLVEFLQEERGGNPHVLNAQDFLYTTTESTQYHTVRNNIQLKYLFRFAKKMKELKDHPDDIMNRLREFPEELHRKNLENYADSEKINKIRYEVSKALEQGDDIDLEKLKTETNKTYEKDILHSWSNFSILAQLILNYYSERINTYMNDLSEDLIDHLDTDGLAQHWVTFQGVQNFPNPEAWLVIYPESKPRHQDAYHLSVSFAPDQVNFGLISGDNTPESISETERIYSEDDLNVNKILETLREKENRFRELNARQYQLGTPFDDIFTDRDEAEKAFDILRDTFDGLGVDQPGDERVVLNFRYNRQAIHFTFGQWFVIGFYGPGMNRERISTVMLNEHIKEQNYKTSEEKEEQFTLSTDQDEPDVSFCRFSLEEFRSSDVQNHFHETLDVVREQFETWERSNYRQHHVPELEDMVFDEYTCDQYLSNGINKKNHFWVTANPDLWSVEEIVDGGEIFYTYKTEEKETKHIKSVFQEAKEGDRVIFYESSPESKVIGTGEITEGLHMEVPENKNEEQEGISMKFCNRTSGIDWDILNKVPELQNSSPIRNKAHGSLFKLTREEYETILSLEQKMEQSWEELTDVKTKRRFRIQPVGGQKTLHFPDTLEEALERQITGAIRAGKHIILVGPPGTGKSKLAKRICEFYLEDPDRYNMTTATSDWSTFDTIGGLMPVQDTDVEQLTFNPGLFLNCFRDGNRPANNWLIIDEINRADIDKAFGSLFSVLTGDAITLSHNADNGRPIRVRPEQDEENVADIEQHEYVLPDDWRLIATMNTYDKSSLYEMSYAFMRRFAFVPVPVPGEITNEDMEAYMSTWGNVSGDGDLVEPALSLWNAIRKHRDIGPAIVRDLLQHVDGGGDWTSAVFLYVFPQFEGLRKDDQVSLIDDLTKLDVIDRERMGKQAMDFFRLDPGHFEDEED